MTRVPAEDTCEAAGTEQAARPSLPKSPWAESTGRGAPKWNGVSTYRLQSSVEQLSATLRAKFTVVTALRAQEEAQRKAVAEAIADLLKHSGTFIDEHSGKLSTKGRAILPSDLVPKFAWDCPTSPTRNCVYLIGDPWMDDCIFCRDPHERK